jgi:uridine phosphorylase
MCLQHKKYPILEFDPKNHAVIEPSRLIKPLYVTSHSVPCYFREVLSALEETGEAKKIASLKTELGENPVFELETKRGKIIVYHPGLGGPYAALMFEKVIALGCSKFIACGGAGVLNNEIQLGQVIVPTSCVRDEGTSYHYIAPGREIKTNENVLRVIERVLTKNQCSYIKGKTWTTDALYRETIDKIELRKSEGCITVEMEAASLFAIAEFRNVQYGQIIYAGDDVSQLDWNARKWKEQVKKRKKVFWLAVEACLELD